MYLKSLYTCYKKPSTAKQTIYDICVRKATKDRAVEYGVLSYNAHFFTFAYRKPNNEIVVIRPSTFYAICRDVM